MQSNLFMGCDVARKDFAYCLRNSDGILLQGSVENSERAIIKWLSQLKKTLSIELKTVIFCQEHTGVYGLKLMRVLYARNLKVSVEGAANIKLSLGLQRGKTDKVDAARIAEYAMRYTDRLKLWKPKREVLDRLSQLLNTRNGLLAVRTNLMNQLSEEKEFKGQVMYAIMKKLFRPTLTATEKSIKLAEKQIQDLIQSDENLFRLNTLVTSVDGIGKITSATILVRTNEFQDYTEAKKFACTAGVAPFEYKSGSSIRGKTRVSHHAHKDLKTLLHMCAIGCISRKGELKEYYERMVRTGKNKMSVINGVRNKLIHRIFAVVRTGIMYDKNYKYNLVLS